MNEAKRHVKVARFQILKPTGDMTWKQLAKLLRDARYRVFRLANLAVSENYLNFHMFRTRREHKKSTIGQLNRRLREMLVEEEAPEEELARFSKEGALPASVYDALSRYKIRALTVHAKWGDVTRGKASLPTFRSDISIPIRCDKAASRRLERMPNGDVQVDLQVCLKPYPRVVLMTGKIGDGVRAILDRLLDNPDQNMNGYRQRCFEVKHDDRNKRWWLYVTYDFPAEKQSSLNTAVAVGVDLGVSCPLYAAISNGHARLGRRQFRALGARIRSLQTQVMARRRGMQAGGQVAVSQETARSGHGRKRKLRPIEKLEGRINDAYNTLNHQLSTAVIDFARNHGAGVIQIENLDDLKETLRGTYLGGRWRYHQFRQFLEYKSKEAGIELRRVNPRYTSRRCSKCGFIYVQFDRAFRDAGSRNGRPRGFSCPECGYGSENYVDPDYNAARNLADLEIEAKIAEQCKKQGLDGSSESSDDL